MHPYLPATRFPTELVHEIINFLTTPKYSRQYGYTKDVTHALSQLCLVNHYFYDISVSYLYSSIVITDKYQLPAFVSTLDASIVICSYTYSLSIPNFFFDLYPSSHIIPWVCDLLNLVSPYLRRLSVCTVGSDMGPSSLMRETFDRFTDLEEFVCMGSAGRAKVCLWPEWKSLRYLLLEGAEVEQYFIDSIALMPCLTQLGLLDASWGNDFLGHDVELRRIIGLSKAGRCLRKIILGYSSLPARTPQLLASLRLEFSKTPLREGLDIQCGQLRSTEGRNSWNSRTSDDIASDGSFWELESISVLDTDADLFEHSP